jgi:hypothetical protein
LYEEGKYIFAGELTHRPSYGPWLMCLHLSLHRGSTPYIGVLRGSLLALRLLRVESADVSYVGYLATLDLAYDVQ